MIATNQSPRTISIVEAARLLGIGKDLAYQEAKTGKLAGATVLRIGHRMVIPRAELERVLGESIEGEGLLTAK